MKKNLRFLPLSLLLVTLSACQTMAPSSEKTSNLEETLKRKNKALNVSVSTILESDVKAAQCEPLSAKLKEKWDWREAIGAANACVKAKNFGAAERLANLLAVNNTTTPWGPYYFAVISFERGQLDRAQWMSELALKRAPEYGVLYYLKAQILWAKQNFKESVENFEKSLVYDDSNGSAHLLLGQVYFQDENFSKAVPHFEAALKLLPDNLVALNGQAQSQFKLNNVQVALEAYIRLSQIDPTDGQYLTHVGDIYEGNLNDHVHALAAYQKLRELTKSGKIKKNTDPENEAKIKEVESTLKKQRAVASEKGARQ